MADNRYLIRQRQTWYVVVETPPSLRKRLGRRIKQTLGTRDINVARARRWGVLAKIKDMIEDTRKGREGDPLTVEALAFRDALAAAQAYEEAHAHDDDADPSIDWDDPATIIWHSENSPSALLRADLTRRAEAIERASGTPTAQSFYEIAEGITTPLATYVDQWLSEGALRGVPLKERTKIERRRAVDKLAEWMVRTKIAPTVEAVTRRVAGRYVSDELIPSGRDPVTLGKSVRSLSSYWAWLQKRGRLPEEARNPWSGQAPQKRANDFNLGDERAFTDGEVVRLLASPPSDTLADFMLVGALTGMRREEIGQLRVADCADGVFVIQRGKTAAARRRVPIHPSLAEIVARRSRGKPTTAYLFHELASKNVERTDPIGKLFTRYRRSLGIQDGEGRRSLVNFHSWRRWFVTKAVNAGQPAHIVALVVGHKEGRKGMTLGRYWQGADDGALRACVEAVKLPTQAPIAVPSGPLQSAA